MDDLCIQGKDNLLGHLSGELLPGSHPAGRPGSEASSLELVALWPAAETHAAPQPPYLPAMVGPHRVLAERGGRGTRWCRGRQEASGHRHSRPGIGTELSS